MKIAIVCGRRDQADVIAVLLNAAGHVCSLNDVESLLLEPARIDDYDLFIVNTEGWANGESAAAIKALRAEAGCCKPIMLLTGCEIERDVAAVFTAIADGRIDGPARAGPPADAPLRSPGVPAHLPSELIRVADYEMDAARRRVTLRGQVLKLSRREFDLGLFMFRHVGRLVPRSVLEKTIWGRELDFHSKTLDTHVYRLRVKLQLQPENGLQLSSVYAQGFRLMPVMAQAPAEDAYA